MNSLISVVVALILTTLIECIIIIIWQNDKRSIYAFIVCNLATNPAVNCMMLAVRHFTDNMIVYYSILGMLEILTILVEMLIYRKFTACDSKKAFKVSIAVNCCSFFFGLALSMSVFG